MKTLKLETKNHGKPQCPEIITNPKKASRNLPQAWENKGNWFYNYPGALKEAEFLGETIPEIDDLVGLVTENKDNMEFAGCRFAGDGVFYGAGDFAVVWSSSPKGDENAHYAILGRGYADAFGDWYDRGHGMSLRFLADKSDSLSPSTLEEPSVSELLKNILSELKEIREDINYHWNGR